jgi:hypothetical protein
MIELAAPAPAAPADAFPAAPAPPPQPQRLPIRFTGSGGEYFRIWIVNLLLTLVTLGIWSAWAKVRKTRYFWSNTQLAGAAFRYHGNPGAILRGRLLAGAFFEREADEDGVRFLRAAGRSALPMVDALCLLQGVEREAALGGLPKLLSTHPKLAERIEHVRELGGVDPSYRCPDPPPRAGPTCGPDDDEDEPATGGPEGAPRPGGE